MHYPSGRCRQCGERLYEHVEGGYQCLNCETRYAAADSAFAIGGAEAD